TFICFILCVKKDGLASALLRLTRAGISDRRQDILGRRLGRDPWDIERRLGRFLEDQGKSLPAPAFDQHLFVFGDIDTSERRLRASE
ncbi:MAG: hypothetical protein KKG88_03030, partial [Proteobacteria bacterium]|nr:hypothetical protein [Pseudomonadota bacterium]